MSFRSYSHSGIRTGLLLLLLVFFNHHSFSQQSQTLFGVGIRPGFPSRYFRTGPILFSDKNIDYSIVQKSGISYGGFIRHGITGRLSLETGITYTKRNYEVSLQDSTFTGRDDFSIVGYEIPLNAIVNIQLGPEFWINAGLGGAIDVFPSDVATFDNYYVQYSARKQKVNAAVTATLGAEWRDKSAGVIYAGFIYHRAVSSIYDTLVEYYPNRDPASAPSSTGRTLLEGDYFGIDLKYFFPWKQGEKKSAKTK